VGVDVDLGGVGKRKAEADPFAGPAGKTSAPAANADDDCPKRYKELLALLETLKPAAERLDRAAQDYNDAIRAVNDAAKAQIEAGKELLRAQMLGKSAQLANPDEPPKLSRAQAGRIASAQKNYDQAKARYEKALTEMENARIYYVACLEARDSAADSYDESLKKYDARCRHYKAGPHYPKGPQAPNGKAHAPPLDLPKVPGVAPKKEPPKQAPSPTPVTKVPPTATPSDKANDCPERYAKLAKDLAEYQAALKEIQDLQDQLNTLDSQAAGAEQELESAYEDQDMGKIRELEETLQQVAEELPSVNKKLDEAFAKANRLHDALAKERADYLAHCPHDKPPPEIPAMPPDWRKKEQGLHLDKIMPPPDNECAELYKKVVAAEQEYLKRLDDLVAKGSASNAAGDRVRELNKPLDAARAALDAAKEGYSQAYHAFRMGKGTQAAADDVAWGKVKAAQAEFDKQEDALAKSPEYQKALAERTKAWDEWKKADDAERAALKAFDAARAEYEKRCGPYNSPKKEEEERQEVG
jgi:DNA repair exonuclease SbcCD ATPase subunit